MSNDQYASFDYSRLIPWEPRLKREWEFLGPILETAPERSLLDLGSASGEHTRFIAAKGFDALGIDVSEAMVEKARGLTESLGTSGVHFVAGNMRDSAALIDRRRGAAICVGNALPHLTGEGDLAIFASNLKRSLLPGAPVIVQILNYARFEAKKERALPVTFLKDPEDPESAIVFLRTMELLPDRRVVFMPTVLRQRPDREPPLELLGTQRVEIRGWRYDELERSFRDAGFTEVEIRGSYQDGHFVPEESRDVVLVARA